MPDTPPSAPQPPTTPSKTPSSRPDAGHVPMTEEFDSAKWSLPPAMPIVLALAGVAIIVFVIAFAMRAKPVASGAITNVAAFDQENNVLVAVRVTLDNKIEKQLWIRDISSELETSDGKKYPDHAASAVDAERYLAAFSPEKRASVKAEPMAEELKIQPGKSYTGFLIFSYPVNQAAFDARKSLAVKIAMYDQPAVVLKQPPE